MRTTTLNMLFVCAASSTYWRTTSAFSRLVSFSAFTDPLLPIQRTKYHPSERSKPTKRSKSIGSDASSSSASTTALSAQYKGLETRREGATPTEGGMTLYLKAGPPRSEATSSRPLATIGDCPFAQFVSMVLEEKGLPYDIQPCTPDSKPAWLVEHYEGKMPALRHRKECYVESNVIADYLDFFFPEPPLHGDPQAEAAAEEAAEGLFPAVAQYLKHTPDGDENCRAKQANVEAALAKLEQHLKSLADNNDSDTPLYMTGSAQCSMVDCQLAPKLFHLQVGLKAFKGNAIDISRQFPAVAAYMEAVFARDSFQATVVPSEVVEWGWGNARVK